MNFYSVLKLQKRIKNRRLKAFGLFVASVLGIRHLSVRIDPVLQCNLACKMCYFSSPEFRQKSRGRIKEDEFDGIARTLFPHAFQLVVGCAAEPTLSRNYIDLFRLAHKYGVNDTSIVTNGQLLRRKDFEQMAEWGVGEIILSVHGVRTETYEKFMPGARFDRLIEVLETYKDIQSNNSTSFPKLRINYTVNPDNLLELRGFFDVFDSYKITTLQVRPVMDIGGEYIDSIKGELVFEYKDVIAFLAGECKKRGVRLLANTIDAGYEEKNQDAAVAEMVYTYISPKTAGQLGFDWNKSNIRQFKRSLNWYNDVFRLIFGKKKSEGWLDRSLKYDQLN